MSLEQQISELFAQRDELADSITGKWVSCIHDAFYGPYATERGSNKFLELETTLAHTFAGLSAIDAGAFWRLTVLVLLRLAQKTLGTETTDARIGKGDELDETDSNKATNLKKTHKKSKKKAQPNAPLAFMVVNALRTLTEEENSCGQFIQDQEKEMLEDFCVRGLQDSNFVDQKLVVEILDLFTITDVDAQIVQGAAQSLLVSKKYTALVKLLTIFNSLEWSFEAMIKTMTKCKDWAAAELLVRTFGSPEDKGNV
ncbi:Hypothetical protein PHPALM_18802 [Phytophthora palmivora]|uniref:Uncharacterized protein n=1 Tax=Phytophthora palmivora TaxID=4796 RepID=A0A2P4XIT4_9STRA|nr:Hypothetical protein PHPALM_18802 [Phytophthora palmivora]